MSALEIGGASQDRALGAANVSKRYGRSTWALRDVSIRIQPSEIIALVGPNGAGKSTLIKLWAGFEKPSKGSAYVGDLDAWRRRGEALRRIAYVAQGSPLVRSITAADHLALARSLRPDFDSGSARRRLERLEIPLTVPVSRLSGGQASQVALALALATSAPILLLDEPLATLDPLARRQFMAEALSECRSSGRTLVMSSHVISDIDPADNRLILLDHGSIQLDAAAPRLLGSHFIREAFEGEGSVVGRVRGHDGSVRFLVEGTSDGGHQPSLEEVVLGYLDRVRPE